jgi:hypothetical protein
MKLSALMLAATLLIGSGHVEAQADCQISDAKLEEAVLQNPRLRGPSNRQAVRDLRSLRDAAFTLRSYGRHDDCDRLLGNIRELISGPLMSTLGDNDEEQADKQMNAREPKVRQGGGIGRRAEPGAKPLVAVDGLRSGLRADQITGAEVRTSDDKIVGEVRNVVFGAKDGRDYVIVASGGFFTPGKASIVVPLKSLLVSEDRTSFFLPMAEAGLKAVPTMPDQEYEWLSDAAWRTRNDSLFKRR